MLRQLMIVLITLPGGLAVAHEADGVPVETAWGTILKGSPASGRYELSIQNRPSDARLRMPAPFPHIVRCLSDSGDRRIDFEFNRDASALTLLWPGDESAAASASGRVIVETSEQSQQFADGRIVFSALDARVVGERAQLESHPGNHRIGFWTNANDYVAWSYDATRWGMYDVLLTYSSAAPDGSRVEVEMASEKSEAVTVDATLKSTGSWYRYTTIDVGQIYLASSGAHALSVKCLKKVGVAVMNLKSVILVPACEGTPPVQGDDGIVTLHGRDATIHGTTLRWEPAEKKRTIGYWIKSGDAVAWTFELSQPGEYDVEVLQGCGKGQGGSQMLIQGPTQPIRWQVEETGHFQKFEPRIVGRFNFSESGENKITVQPTKIAAQAACDIRQIRLIPVKE